MVSSFTRFRDHTQRRATVGGTPLDEWSARRTDLHMTTHTHTKQTNIHAAGGIRTHDHSRRAAVDLRLRSRSHWDRLLNSSTRWKWVLNFTPRYLNTRTHRYPLDIWLDGARAGLGGLEKRYFLQLSGIENWEEHYKYYLLHTYCPTTRCRTGYFYSCMRCRLGFSVPHLYEQRGLYLLVKGVGCGNVIALCQQQVIRQSVYTCITTGNFNFVKRK
jgi:hypothetical protein